MAIANPQADDPGKRRGIELESSRTFSSALVRDLQSPDSARAARAALALGRIRDARALAPLLSRFEQRGQTPARAFAIYAVGLLSGVTRVDAAPVIAALGDPAGVVRAAAVDAAGRVIAARQPSARALFAPLVARMRHDAQPSVRARAAVALAAFAPRFTPAGAAVAAAFCAEDDRMVRAHEAWTLGRAFPRAPSRRTLLAGLADRDDLVRMAFIDVTAKRQEPDGAALITGLRNDRSWRVAEEAREGLRRLRGQGRTQHLRAIPAGIRIPPAPPVSLTRALARPHSSGPPQRPRAAGADVSLSLLPLTAAALDAPSSGMHPRVRISTTKGSIVVRLYPEWAPLTVANFLNLAERGYYDGLRWFRIVPNFVVQTGDPHDNGDGDAGYAIPAEENPLEQRAGVISMGLDYRGDAPLRDSAGTQFYLTISPQYHLNMAFTVFGRIESGFPVLGRLVESDRMTRVERIEPD